MKEEKEKRFAITVYEVDRDIWLQAKSKAVMLGLRTKDVINQALELWLEKVNRGDKE